MKYEIIYTRRFQKSLKRVQQLKGFKGERLKKVITVLANGEKLATEYRDHKLTGDLKDFRECHLAPDILLIYEIDDGILTLTLVTIGSHSQLFK